MKVRISAAGKQHEKSGKPTQKQIKTAPSSHILRAKPVENSVEKVEIHGESIRLDDFLKFCGAAQTGGMAKVAIQSGDVRLNGEICMVRGKKLQSKDCVSFAGRQYEVVMQ